MTSRSKIYLSASVIALSVILSLILHWPIFKKDITGIHSWRQSQTQLNIRYFYREDPNILNTRVAHFNGGKDNLYRYEFPLMQWSIAMVQKVFGDHITVTRICIFLIGLLTLTAFALLIFSLFKDPLLSALGFWALSFSPVFFYYTVNPIPDNLALCAGIFYLYYAVKNYEKETRKNHLVAALFLSIATLTKLPFVVFGAFTLLYFFQKRQQFKTGLKREFLTNLFLYPLLLLPAFFWYKWVMPGWEGNGILHGIFSNDKSWPHINGILLYHYKVMFPRILMNSVSLILIVVALFYGLKSKSIFTKKNLPFVAVFLMVLLYFVLEINMIDIHHDYYMMPFLPLLYLAIVYGTKKILESKYYLNLAVVPIFLIMPFQNNIQNKDSWSEEKSGFNRDLFTYQQELKNAVPKGQRVIAINDPSNFFYFYKLDKEGYVFNNDYLLVEWLDDLIQYHKVKYMYSDSRKIDENPEMMERFDSVILQKGSIKVIRLKKKD